MYLVCVVGTIRMCCVCGKVYIVDAHVYIVDVSGYILWKIYVYIVGYSRIHCRLLTYMSWSTYVCIVGTHLGDVPEYCTKKYMINYIIAVSNE